MYADFDPSSHIGSVCEGCKDTLSAEIENNFGFDISAMLVTIIPYFTTVTSYLICTVISRLYSTVI